MNDSPVGIKAIIIFMVLVVIVLQKLLSGLNMDASTIISRIAFLLFVGAVGYYLFPQVRIRKHHISTPKHRQYSESEASDLMMKSIMKAYNIKEETDDTEDESNEEIDKEIVGDQENEADKEVCEELKEDVVEDQAGNIDKEIIKETKHRRYNDSRLTDYVMKKIMNAYGVKEEIEEESDEEVDEEISEEEINKDQEDKTDEEINEGPEHRHYANSHFTNYVMKRRRKAYDAQGEADKETGDYVEEFNEEVPKKSENRPQFAIYDGTDEKNTGLIRILFSPVQLPLTLSGLWLITIVIIYNFLPEIEQLIPRSIPSLAFTILPILLLIGLSGFLGVLLEQSNENLEVTFKEKIISALNIFKILIGWGIGIYVFINFFN
jgi:hypothetical protein